MSAKALNPPPPQLVDISGNLVYVHPKLCLKPELQETPFYLAAKSGKTSAEIIEEAKQTVAKAGYNEVGE